MTPQEVFKKLENQRRDIEALEAVWHEWFPEYDLPSKRQFQIWLKFAENNLELIYESFEATHWSASCLLGFGLLERDRLRFDWQPFLAWEALRG